MIDLLKYAKKSKCGAIFRKLDSHRTAAARTGGHAPSLVVALTPRLLKHYNVTLIHAEEGYIYNVRKSSDKKRKIETSIIERDGLKKKAF